MAVPGAASTFTDTLVSDLTTSHGQRITFALVFREGRPAALVVGVLTAGTTTVLLFHLREALKHVVAHRVNDCCAWTLAQDFLLESTTEGLALVTTSVKAVSHTFLTLASGLGALPAELRAELEGGLHVVSGIAVLVSLMLSKEHLLS